MKNDMDKYTLIVDYMGSTFISQILCFEFIRDYELWMEEIPDKEGTLYKIVQTLQYKFCDKDYKLTPVDGCVNVWCESSMLNDELALINIVKTAT